MGIIIILIVIVLYVYNTEVNPISFLWVKVFHANSQVDWFSSPKSVQITEPSRSPLSVSVSHCEFG